MHVTIWNENVDETQGVQKVLDIHPEGIHNTLRGIVEEIEGATVTTATLQQPECGLTDDVLDKTDVLIWWSHKAQGDLPDELAEKIHQKVLGGMGFLALHSAHYSKPLRRLLGTTCDLYWRNNQYERMFCVAPNHPIAAGVPVQFEVGEEEMYSEPFDIAPPDELIFLAWFDSGNVFRAGCTWNRGYGRIFYFQPGHESNTSYQNKHVRRIIKNAVEWAYSPRRRTEFGSPHVDPTPEQERLQKN